MGKPVLLIAGYKQCGCRIFFFFYVEHSRFNGYGLTQCPSSFLLQANINKNKIKVDMKKKKKKKSNVRFWNICGM